jgi:heme o synthase
LILKQDSHISQTRVETVEVQQSFLYDLAVLSKLKLSVIVVLSSVLSYAVVSGGSIDFRIAILLGIGGMLITASANALNQVLEREFDALMKRTIDRPLVTGRMTVSNAVLIAGIMGVVGILTLACINNFVAMLGTLSLMLYAFVYTPLKRYTTASVAVGAIPGALPVLIGTVAFDGSLTMLGLFLFGIQFFWQFPHFWAIGYRSFADYRSAGFELVPYNRVTGEVDSKIGTSSLIYSIIMILMMIAAYVIGLISTQAFIPCIILALGYTYYCIQFARNLSNETATRLMLYSFLFMPIFLFVLILL